MFTKATCTFFQPFVSSVKKDCQSSACSASAPPSLISNSTVWPEPVPFTQKLKPSYALQSCGAARSCEKPP